LTCTRIGWVSSWNPNITSETIPNWYQYLLGGGLKVLWASYEDYINPNIGNPSITPTKSQPWTLTPRPTLHIWKFLKVSINTNYTIYYHKRVKFPIIEHIPTLNIFQYFTHSLSKVNDFCVIESANWRVTNVLWVSEVKEQCKEHQKRMNDSFVSNFWNK
jgi:hypothetical protein